MIGIDLPDWVADVVKRSLACPECKGKRECMHAIDLPGPIVMEFIDWMRSLDLDHPFEQEDEALCAEFFAERIEKKAAE